MNADWKTYNVLVGNAWERLPGAPSDLDHRIALGNVETRRIKDKGRSVMQWRPFKAAGAVR